MPWRVARSLNVLLEQLNALAPRRNKAADGSIGDAAHASRNSDHNPWYGPGIVTARDYTHDPAGGLDCNWLAARLVASRDRRIKYIIWNRRIWQSGTWYSYTGSNAHTHHLHLSVVASPACDDTSPWNLSTPSPAASRAGTAATEEDEDMVKFLKGDSTVPIPGTKNVYGDVVFKVEFAHDGPQVAVRTRVPSGTDPGYRAFLAAGGKVHTVPQAVLDAIEDKVVVAPPAA